MKYVRRIAVCIVKSVFMGLLLTLVTGILLPLVPFKSMWSGYFGVRGDVRLSGIQAEGYRSHTPWATTTEVIYWQEGTPPRPPIDIVAEREALNALAYSDHNTLRDLYPPSMKALGCRLEQWGMPFHWLWYWQSGAHSSSQTWDGALVLPSSWRPIAGLPPAIPTKVIWTNFVLNATFYAALAPIMAYAAGAICHSLRRLGGLRAALRRRRGLCPHCAYDLRGLAAGAKCPECGSASISAR